MKTRQAIMRVSVATLDMLRLDDARQRGEPTCDLDYFCKTPEAMHRLLMLPKNATVKAASEHAYFAYGQVAVRVECPDFVETEEGWALPNVEAYHRLTQGGGATKTEFDHWEGPAVDVAIDPEPTPLLVQAKE